MTPAPEPASLPEALARRFSPLGTLGKGGMGLVLRARDRTSGREVALEVSLCRGEDE